jgi:Domain of unknown function (DUF1707)
MPVGCQSEHVSPGVGPPASASAEGRLTLSELTERTEAAYTATTRGELASITAGLPAGSRSPVASRPAGQADREWVVAVRGDVKVIGDSYAEPVRRTLRAWLTRDDRDRRAIE